MTHLFDPPKPNQPATPDVNHGNNHHLNNGDGNIHPDEITKDLSNSQLDSQIDSQPTCNLYSAILIFIALEWTSFSQIADKVFWCW